MRKIGVFTSGGDSPGMNAAVRAVVRTAVYNGIEVVGIRRGYEGMIDNDMIDLDIRDVSNIIQRGGTFLKSARSKQFRTEEGRTVAATNLKNKQIDALVCVGGDGSYMGAHFLEKEHGIKCVGIPGTIDNDLYGTDYTIGFDTAINTALDAIDRVRDTADSHNRVFFIEVMGRDSGFIALHTGIAGGAESVIIPEDKSDTQKLIDHFKDEERRKKAFSIVVVAEGDEEGGAAALSKKISDLYPDLRIRTTVLGHIQRGGSPSAKDRILASRLGHEAVNTLLGGKSNCALGIVNDEIFVSQLYDASNKCKTVSAQLIKMAEILAI